MTTIINYVTTSRGRAKEVIDFINANEFFIAYGKTSAWDSSYGVGINDTNPPAPTDATVEIEETFLLKEALRVQPAITSNCIIDTQLVCNSTTFDFQLVDLENSTEAAIYNTNFEYLYIQGELEPTDDGFVNTEYRATGLFLNPTFNVPSGAVIYTPAEVDDYGLLHSVTYSTPVIRTLTAKVSTVFLIKL